MTVKLSLLAAMRQMVLFALTPTAITLSVGLPSWAKPAMLQARYADSQINVRSAPSTVASLVSTGWVGDRVEVLREARGRDGANWSYVRFERGRLAGWVRSDLVQIQRSPLPAPSLGNSSAIAVRPQPSSANPTKVTTLRPKSLALSSYTPEQISYFLEVAMGGEFGASASRVRKWQGPVKIKIHGSPTPEDLRTLQAVIQDIEGVTEGLQLQMNQDNPNMEIYFVPESDFRRYEPNYQALNYGFFWTYWDQQNTIYNAKILISTVGVSQKERSHLIREELTQSLGLMQDSNRYPDSIFFQGWTDPTEYSEIDKALLRMLYRPEIQPGMTRSQVAQVLSQWQTANQSSAVTQHLGDRAPLDFSLPAVPQVGH
ncbi:DUF2927 domain-containing protein [Trichocoleus sp. FACHB-262]|uniref:DUF2927 domain-containing protein n=1 Tax=Trichocoleus sp. FACHB-262 TaxID=2692869 RepID=UPI0018EFD9DB|nr:DUF2927 domain-containing protein [Trichocoleus sp. FACHB-262]